MTPQIGTFQFPDTTIHRVLDSLLSKGLCNGTGNAEALGEMAAEEIEIAKAARDAQAEVRA